ncbi:MAG: AAA family ATPase [Bacilli bacterium]|nr:AAA family ATPase [Bacilli bacterium]
MQEIRYGINYKVVKVKDKKYLLFPVSLVKGECDGYDLVENNHTHKVLSFASDLKSKYVLDNVYSLEELKTIYDIEEEEEFLTGYFFEDKKDKAVLVEIHKDFDAMKKTEIDLKNTELTNYGATCLMDKDKPSILLNENLLEELTSTEDIHQMKVLLEKYRNMIGSFKEINKKEKVTRIYLQNGKVKSVDTLKSIEQRRNVVEKKETLKKEEKSSSDISYIGLRNAIKEKVFSHVEEIDTFADKLYMNYTAEEGEGIESILLVGPTGVGKTETVSAACEYLNIPYLSVNASNLVPQGIVGTSMEDVMISLYELAGRDLEKAERGLIFLDEFDKLNKSILDYKKAIKSILLTFTTGGDFPVRNDDYSFTYHSKMTNKVFAGVFEDIMEQDKKLGFGQDNKEKSLLKDEKEIRERLIKKGYFTKEELSRISTILGYEELTREIKKEIILKSKLSEYIKKKNRYKRQFNIDLILEDSFIDAILDTLEKEQTGMRVVNNLLKKSMDYAEKEILECPKKYKSLLLTRDTVVNNRNFYLS